MDEERGGGHDKGSVWCKYVPLRMLGYVAFSPVRLAMAWPFNYITNFFDLCISSAFRLTLYIYRLVAGRLPLFLEDAEDSRIKLEEVMRECAHLKQNVNRLKEDKDTLVREKEDALRRLSEVVSVRLRDNNPNIADLNDQCRPTKLAEMFSELYDNEWTAAYSVLAAELDETSTIKLLLQIMMQAYDFCEDTVAGPWDVVTKWFLDMDLPGSQQTAKWLKDSRKSNVRSKLPEVLDEFKKGLMKNHQDNKIADLLKEDVVNKYLEKCIELSLLMVTSDPPVVMSCPRVEGDCKDIGHTGERQLVISTANGSGRDEKCKAEQKNHVGKVESIREESVFNKEMFKEYTQRGKYFDYIVWPALLLHRDGPILGKGIAQGRTSIRNLDRGSSD